MSVNILVCEGNSKSPDGRLLHRLLAGQCQVVPVGSKHTISKSVPAKRQERNSRNIYGLMDRDFIPIWETPIDQPKDWTDKEGHHLGWYWERKEIENYLLDPVVVSKSLGKAAPTNYSEILNEAAEQIWRYQAARTALSNCSKYFRPLQTSFGKKRGKEKHQFPDNCDDSSCCQGIRATVELYRSQNQLVEETEVLQRYQALLPEFDQQGERRKFFLYSFAGKDLMWAMEERLKNLGFNGAKGFQEKILLGIENTSEDIANWLPAWQALQRIIKTVA